MFIVQAAITSAVYVFKTEFVKEEGGLDVFGTAANRVPFEPLNNDRLGREDDTSVSTLLS